MKPLKVAVVGLGWFGEIHCETIMGIPDLKLFALCTRNKERLDYLASKFNSLYNTTNYQDIVNNHEIDIIVVSTPPETHAKICVDALIAGKHVFLEKPIASNLTDALLIIEAAHNSIGLLMVGHICRFNNRYRAVHQIITEGRIGEILSIKTHRNLPASKTARLLNTTSPFVSDAIHDLNLIIWFSGQTHGELFAQSLYHRGLAFPDICHILIKFQSGILANLEVNWHTANLTMNEVDEFLRITGTDGTVQLGGTFESIHVTGSNTIYSPDLTYWPKFQGIRQGALREEYFEFVRNINNGVISDIANPVGGLEALRLALAADESARSNKILMV